MCLLFWAGASLAAEESPVDGRLNVPGYSRPVILNGEWWIRPADLSPFQNDLVRAPDATEAPPAPILFSISEDWPLAEQFKGYTGMAWRGLRLILPERAPTEPQGLLFPLHSPGFEIYWNGRFLRATRAIDEQGRSPRVHGSPTLVPIPLEWIRPGENTLELRGGTVDAGSGVGEYLLFGSIEQLYRQWTHTVLWYGALFSISLFLAVYNFLFYFQDRSEPYYLHFAFVNLTIGLWVLGWHGLSYMIIDSYAVSIFCIFFCGIMTIYLLLKFIHSFLNVRENWLDRLVQYFYLALTLAFCVDLVVFGGAEHFVRHLLGPYLQSMGFVILYMIWINVRAIRNRQPFARFFFAGLMVLLVFATYSTFVFLKIVDDTPRVNEGFFGMVMVFATVLARRYSRVHKDLKTAHGDLLVLDRMKDDFLATTSHELRTPLHGIMGLVSGIRDEDLGPINAEQKENLVLIHDSARRLSVLVDDILNFSKIRAGKMDLFLEPLALGDVIQTVVSLSRGLIGEKPLRIETDVPAGLPPVNADGVRIQQVLFNLVGNAIKYSAEGTIRLTVARLDSDRLEVSVSDEGVGIPAAQLERIWRPFEQLEDDVNTRLHAGTGLGLAVSRELVEMHRGSIRVQSEPGRGSTFSFDLPVYRAGENQPGLRRVRSADPALPARARMFQPVDSGAVEAQDAQRYSSLAQGDGKSEATRERPQFAREKKFQILAIDDDSTNLQIIRQMLGSAGYETTTARSGPAGLELLDDREYDLVLLDLMMPGMSGYEVCERIRAEHPEYLPILMLTARNELEDRLRGFALGANDYLSKPFDKNELLSRIENQLAIKYLLDAEQNLVEELQGEKSQIELNLVQRSRQLKAATERIRAWETMITEDMELAEKFQKRMLSYDRPPAGVELYDRYEPLLKIGGDIYNVFQTGPGRLRIFLADAAGHGINASLNTVKILSEYDVVKRFLESPVDILEHLAGAFRPDEQGYMILFSAVVVDLDLERDELRFASAGHLEQFLLTPTAGTSSGKTFVRATYGPGDGGPLVRALKPRGPLIGFPVKCVYEEVTCDFPSGSVLFLYTDGLLNNLQSELDESTIGERLAAFEKQNTLQVNCDALITDLNRAGGVLSELEDDMTVLAVRRVTG